MATDAKILAYYLWDGDRTPVTLFANRMLVTRKPHPCVICREDIGSGTRVRAQTERDDDDRIVATFYVCPVCCEACAVAGTPADPAAEQIEARHALGMARTFKGSVSE